MATYIKGNITYLPVVDQINRKFTPKKNTCKAASQLGPVKTIPAKFMGGATRKSTRGIIGAVSKNYMFFRENPRTSALSSAEIEGRSLFIQVRAAVQYIKEDLTQIARVNQLFKNAQHDASKRCNGISTSGYTLDGWIFAVQYAGKKASHEYNVNTFPSAYDA